MSFFEFSFHISPEKNIFPWSQKIPGLIWGFFFEFFLKIVINWYSFSKLCDRRSFYDHSQNMWSTITHNHDRWNLVKKYLQSLMIVIWLEMIGDHDPISPTLTMTSFSFLFTFLARNFFLKRLVFLKCLTSFVSYWNFFIVIWPYQLANKWEIILLFWRKQQ